MLKLRVSIDLPKHIPTYLSNTTYFEIIDSLSYFLTLESNSYTYNYKDF